MTDPTPDPTGGYVVMNGWLVEAVNEHTCGTNRGGYYGAHEPGCGYEPIAKVADLLAAADEVRALRAENQQITNTLAIHKAEAANARLVANEVRAERDSALAEVAVLREREAAVRDLAETVRTRMMATAKPEEIIAALDGET